MVQSEIRDRSFAFLKVNERPAKPRKHGITEIRGPYYSPMGKRYLEDILETMGFYVDALKFAGGSFSLMPREIVKELIDLCHDHDVLVSTGGFIEYVLTQGSEAVQRYIQECRELGFDIVEISCGFITIPTEDWLRLVGAVQKVGLKAKPEVEFSLVPEAPRPLPSLRLKERATRSRQSSRRAFFWTREPT